MVCLVLAALVIIFEQLGLSGERYAHRDEATSWHPAIVHAPAHSTSHPPTKLPRCR